MPKINRLRLSYRQQSIIEWVAGLLKFSKIKIILEPAELFIFKVIAVILCANSFLIFQVKPTIDWFGYGVLALVGAGCFFGGQFYRVSGRSPRIGLALICTGIFPMFSWSIVMFNYLLMPTNRPPIDEALIWFDSLYGFHWPDIMAWGAAHPSISKVLKFAYMSTITQMGLLIIILGMTGRKQQLHGMMVSIVVTSVIAVVFWGIFPTHGAKSLYTLAPGIEQLVQPSVTTAYGRDLIQMATNGPGLISPSNVKGLIGFPSYHVVLALTSAYCMRGVRGWFPIFIVLNALVIVATPLHGGHHFVDIFGGAALFLFGTIVAERFVAQIYRKEGTVAVLESDFGQPTTA